MPPANIDMSAIQAALARRAATGTPAGGTTMPAQGQMSQPGGLTPTGNPNVPGTPTPQAPPSTPMAPPQGAPQSAQVPQQAMPKQANFDEETKNVGKALITQLLKYL